MARYFFTKDSDKNGISLLKKAFDEDGKEFIISNLIKNKEPLILYDKNKKYRVVLIEDKIYVERLR